MNERLEVLESAAAAAAAAAVVLLLGVMNIVVTVMVIVVGMFSVRMWRDMDVVRERGREVYVGDSSGSSSSSSSRKKNGEFDLRS